MKIRLKGWKVKNLSLNIITNQEEDESTKESFNLSMGNSFFEQKPQIFSISFQIKIVDKELVLDLEMLFSFETDNDIDEQFTKSDFVKINAPAIAFPYVRSFISNLSLQSGFSPIILPTVNFVQMVRDREMKK